MFRPSYSDSFGPGPGGAGPVQPRRKRSRRARRSASSPMSRLSSARSSRASRSWGRAASARKQAAQCASILAMVASRSTAGGPSGMSGSYGTSLGLGLVVTAGVALQQHRARAVQPGQAGLGDLGHAEDGAVVQPSRPQALGMERPPAALRLGLDDLGVQPLKR